MIHRLVFVAVLVVLLLQLQVNVLNKRPFHWLRLATLLQLQQFQLDWDPTRPAPSLVVHLLEFASTAANRVVTRAAQADRELREREVQADREYCERQAQAEMELRERVIRVHEEVMAVRKTEAHANLDMQRNLASMLQQMAASQAELLMLQSQSN